MPSTDEEKRYIVFTTYEGEIEYQIFHELHGGSVLTNCQMPSPSTGLSVHYTSCMKIVLLYTDPKDTNRHRLGRLPVPQNLSHLDIHGWPRSASRAMLIPRSEVKKRGLRPCKHCYRWGRNA